MNNQNPLICDPETGVCEVPESAIQNEKIKNTGIPNDKLRLLYFTDPICSSCWGIEPQLRKLKLEYGHLIDFEYYMGGLLPDWNYNSGGISKPADVADHWDEVSKYYEMPIDGDIWHENPLHSSYPPSRAFKGAQIQDPEKSVSFLRYLRILLFVDKKNITEWKVIEKAAKIAGLDIHQLETDINNGKAEELFQADLKLARNMGVRGFPSIFMRTSDGAEEFIYGSRPYEEYEKRILKLKPEARKINYEKSLENLFANFSSLTVKEFSVLAEIDMMKAYKVLENTADIPKIVSKNGTVYLNEELK